MLTRTLSDADLEVMVQAYAAYFGLLRTSIHKDTVAAIRAAYLACPAPEAK